MKSTKKSLIFSALSLLLCCALLAGTTFAWFTDSVTNTGNIITAGNLAINAYAYDIGEGGESFTITDVNNSMEFTFEAQAQDLKEENCPPIINDELWEPGKSNAKLLKVENAGTLAVKIRLEFETAGDLTDALWFDFIQINEDGDVTGTFTKRPMSTLSTFAENLELPIIAKGDKLEFILVYGMYEEAGNEYKETDFTANVSILAAQYTYEKDGFDNTDYDKDALYPTVDGTSLLNLFQNDDAEKFIQLGDDIQIAPTDEEQVLAVGSGQKVVINMDNHTLTLPYDGEQYYRPFDMSDGNSSELVLKNGTIDAAGGGTTSQNGTGAYGTIYTEMTCKLTLENMVLKNKRPWGLNVKIGWGSSAVIKNTTVESVTGGGLEVAGGTADLYNNNFTQTGYFDHCSSCIAASTGGTLNVYSGSYISDNYCVYVFNSGAQINIYGGTFKGGKAVLKADAVNLNVYGGSFDGAIQTASSGCYITIYSGTFSNTNLTIDQFRAFVADGYKVISEEQPDGDVLYTVVPE